MYTKEGVEFKLYSRFLLFFLFFFFTKTTPCKHATYLDLFLYKFVITRRGVLLTLLFFFIFIFLKFTFLHRLSVIQNIYIFFFILLTSVVDQKNKKTHKKFTPSLRVVLHFPTFYLFFRSFFVYTCFGNLMKIEIYLYIK